jgi:hypothetical protein
MRFSREFQQKSMIDTLDLSDLPLERLFTSFLSGRFKNIAASQFHQTSNLSKVNDNHSQLLKIP